MNAARKVHRARRLVVLAVVLTLTAVVVPPAAVREAPAALVKVERAQGVAGGKPNVLWILALGSDARPGEPVLRSRADAIQLVGVNKATGAATVIGIPRDSYVQVPGYGRNKINAALTYGGPQLMARAVAGMVGIRPDYVFTTGFLGFRAMVEAVGGITVRSEFAFDDVVMPGGYRVGQNRLNGLQALIFGRIRKSLPRGDFDRSGNQQDLLRGILRTVRANAGEPGFMERALMSVTRNLDTNLRPAELFVLAHALTRLEPGRLRGCVVDGTPGFAGAASVIYPDLGQARSIAARSRGDATLNGPC